MKLGISQIITIFLNSTKYLDLHQIWPDLVWAKMVVVVIGVLVANCGGNIDGGGSPLIFLDLEPPQRREVAIPM